MSHAMSPFEVVCACLLIGFIYWLCLRRTQ